MEAFILILFEEKSKMTIPFNQMVISDGEFIMYYDRESQYITSTLGDNDLGNVDDETALTILALSTYGLLMSQNSEESHLNIYSNIDAEVGPQVISFLLDCIPRLYYHTLPRELTVTYSDLSKVQPLAPHTPGQIKELISIAKAGDHDY